MMSFLRRERRRPTPSIPPPRPQPFRDDDDCEQRLAKTPRTERKRYPEDEDDENDGASSRYPLRSRTPLTLMKNMSKASLYVPPPARTVAEMKASNAKSATTTTTAAGKGGSIPAPRRLVAFAEWQFTTHMCYAVLRQDEIGEFEEMKTDPALKSY